LVKVARSQPDFDLKSHLRQLVADEEKKLITGALNYTRWNRRKAAELLNISYRCLLYKIKEYDLHSKKET